MEGESGSDNDELCSDGESRLEAQQQPESEKATSAPAEQDQAVAERLAQLMQPARDVHLRASLRNLVQELATE